MRVNKIQTQIYIKNKQNLSFAGSKDAIYKKRKRQLDRLGVSDELTEKIVKYSDERYEQALSLLNKGCYEENIEKASRFREKRYKMAVELLKHNIFDTNLNSLTKLGDKKFKRIIELADKGIDSDCLEIYAQLKVNEYRNSIEMMKEGQTPIQAAYLSRLKEPQKVFFIMMINKGISPENAFDIAIQDTKKIEECLQSIDKGISPKEVNSYNSLSEEERKRADYLISLNISDEAAIDISKLDENDYSKAEGMITDGVYPEFIPDIISIEKGKDKVPEYDEYRKRNYSQTSSYALAMLSDDEIDVLTEIIKENPELRKLFKDEYNIELINFQNLDLAEAILKKEIHLNNGTKVTITQTFDEEGNNTISRSEETANHATSSYMPETSDIYRVKYNKQGDIRELNRYILSPETQEVIGVEYLKELELLPGAFESTFYPIKDFKQDNSVENVDCDIKDAVTNDGIPISTVTRDPDGIIKYKESFAYCNSRVIREYLEKKDDNGNLLFSFYSYKITDENKKPLMDIYRSFVRHKDGSATNNINGIEYELSYDDKNKTIIINDGKKSKKIDFKDRLAVYSSEVLWKSIKQLHVDNLLTLDKNIKHWNYCEDDDSTAAGYSKTISSGKDINIITHEIGHFKDYEVNEISNKIDFIEIYISEMCYFLNCVPFNEQEFIEYCSPRADLSGSDGANEFVAESNIILTSYGEKNNKLSTRQQFLVRYFPKSIAKVAELMGKTSKKSLLDD